MSRSALSWPVVIVGILHLVYAAVVFTLWLVGGPTPPAPIGSIIAGSTVSAFILATYRNPRAEIHALAKLLDALAERVREIEERQAAPQQVYVVPAPRKAEAGGLDPESIGAIHRIHDRIRPANGEG